MADELIIATADLGLGAASAKVSIFTCDVNGVRTNAYVGNQVLVESVSTSTGSDGTVTIPLAPTATMSPDNVFYKVTVGNYSKIITKAAGSQTLAAATSPVAPAPLGSALELAGLGDGPSDVPADGDVLTWDAGTDRSEWSPGAGAVDSVNGQVGVVVLDAADVGADAAGTAASVTGVHSADTTAVHGIADTAALASATDLALLIPKALVDAKGDLLAGTAADTVARLPVGDEGSTLVPNSNASTGVAWARWGFSLIRPGLYTSAGGATTTVTTVTNRLHVQAFILHRRTTFDRIAINHTATVGGAGSVARLGIYASGTADVPATLILDAGTVATDTAAAFKAITISQALDPGLYWLGSANQWLTTNPVFTAMSLTAGTSIRPADDGGVNSGGCYYQNTVTGALPNPMVPSATALVAGPLIYLRAA